MAEESRFNNTTLFVRWLDSYLPDGWGTYTSGCVFPERYGTLDGKDEEMSDITDGGAVVIGDWVYFYDLYLKHELPHKNYSICVWGNLGNFARYDEAAGKELGIVKQKAESFGLDTISIVDDSGQFVDYECSRKNAIGNMTQHELCRGFAKKTMLESLCSLYSFIMFPITAPRTMTRDMAKLLRHAGGAVFESVEDLVFDSTSVIDLEAFEFLLFLRERFASSDEDVRKYMEADKLIEEMASVWYSMDNDSFPAEMTYKQAYREVSKYIERHTLEPKFEAIASGVPAADVMA